MLFEAFGVFWAYYQMGRWFEDSPNALRSIRTGAFGYVIIAFYTEHVVLPLSQACALIVRAGIAL